MGSWLAGSRVNRELKQATIFSHGRQPEAGSLLFNLSSHYPIYIVNFLFTSRDD